MLLEKTGGLVIDNTNVTANVRSDIVNVSKGKTVCIDISTADGNSLVSTTQVDACCYLPTNTNAANWQPITLDDGNTTIATNATSGNVLNLSDIGAKYISLFVDYTSGDGTMNAYVHVKDK